MKKRKEKEKRVVRNKFDIYGRGKIGVCKLCGNTGIFFGAK
jgi:hypothetical protein